ncbi:hypothetical protein COW81_02040 [Candidatus Campbellbacteria bacterium CG22_combo_CG10-13_8_21_14_all_36_13]|uniref:D-alanyl-D-alanine carboxypeptidase-like core domain-containing protein n=1 Tax=Candidatus Campbellbacteria bacterium CG22_combo_CG10-13_8_21_14_all_36_13 TaxID=1974529 RepID=A0A2H0DZH3_9BACT|nr:MAG: hypothetical protein COW81_02040 [Candidatus Campbellbacteria bacterium CG22_combo_CG10-13_8_21_14_all_36_13]
MNIIEKIIKVLKKINPFYWILAFIFVCIISGIIYLTLYVKKGDEILSQKIDILVDHIAVLETQFASTTESLEENIRNTESSLSSALQKEKQNVVAIKEQFGNVEQKVGSITGTVTNLEKLSKTDPELLQKYSKVFFLNEHYAPARLSEIPDANKYNEYKDLKISSAVWPYLKNLLASAKSDGIELYVYSAYRSFDEQSALKGIYSVTYGVGTANQFSADQGYSEHQLGTTVDLITTGIGGTLDGFGNTSAYNWLLANAYKYGFILSYPKNNTFYVFEPWHWRFVGVKLATDMHNTGKNFYDLDQRYIDDFLVNIFD